MKRLYVLLGTLVLVCIASLTPWQHKVNMLKVLAAGGACPSGTHYFNSATDTLGTLIGLGVNNGCYYISAAGSDSNSGTDEASPWLHAPFMPACSGNCLTVKNTMIGTAAAGLGFIFRGGDTWHFGNSGAAPYTGGTLEFNASPYPMGTSAHPLYYGFDPAWYSGSSWVRPILTGDNPPCGPGTVGGNCIADTITTSSYEAYHVTTCPYSISGSNNLVDASGSAVGFITLDNFEMTGICAKATGQPFATNVYIEYNEDGGTLTFLNLYIHGWSHLQYQASNGSNCAGIVCFNSFAFEGLANNQATMPADTLRYDVVDGADSDPFGLGAAYASFYDAAYNVFRYQSQGIMRQMHLIHDNLFEYFYENGHSNIIENYPEWPSGDNVLYNNVFRHLELIGRNGGVALWLWPNIGDTDFAFGNSMYDEGRIEAINIGRLYNTGAQQWINNTFDFTAGTGNGFGCGSTAPNAWSLLTINNHFITESATPYNGPCGTYAYGTFVTKTNLQMNHATAGANGYFITQTYANSPISSSSPSVKYGTGGACADLITAAGSDSTLSKAALACQSDTTYACSYNSTTHTNSCPARTPLARPSVTPDAGAYQQGGVPPTTAVPACTPTNGAYSSPQTVNCTDATPSATICVGVNITPTANGAGVCSSLAGEFTYTAPFSQSVPATLKFMASKAGNTDSGVSTNALTLSGASATINWTSVHQVIDGFGATDGQVEDSLTTAQQNFFFGTGSGELGLSLLRAPATDGGEAPGDCSTVSVSCAGVYISDMQAVIANGGRVYSSPWSPPAAYKTNGSTTCTGGGGSGALATASYADYATWLANFVKSLEVEDSISLYAISIQNEPDICEGYDSALWTAANIDTFIKTNLGPTFASDSLSTLIFMPENGSHAELTGADGGGTCAGDSSCYNYIGGINWHDYDATANSSGSIGAAANPWASLNKKYWETEASCGGVSPGSYYGPSGCEHGSFTTDMTVDGLMWAGLLDDRMANQNANAYLYWALLSCPSCTDNEGLGNSVGTIAKRAYVFGQYSKFIRPGYFRIDATHAPQTGVNVTAYQDIPSGTMIIVATNYTGSALSQSFAVTNAPTFTSVTPYITSTSLSLASQTAVAVSGNTFTYSLPAGSVTTFVTASAAPPVLGNPSASPVSGKYTSPQMVTITCPAGATCGFTNDGSDPTTNGGGTIVHGTTYTTPFSQTVPGTVKIIATEAGFQDSSIITVVYTLTGATPLPPTGLNVAPFQQ